MSNEDEYVTVKREDLRIALETAEAGVYGNHGENGWSDADERLWGEACDRLRYAIGERLCWMCGYQHGPGGCVAEADDA